MLPKRLSFDQIMINFYPHLIVSVRSRAPLSIRRLDVRRSDDPVHVAKDDIATQALGDAPPHLSTGNLHVDQGDWYAGNY